MASRLPANCTALAVVAAGLAACLWPSPGDAGWQTFDESDGLAGSCWSILPDSDGNYWFGTDHSGISRYDGATWVTFTFTTGSNPTVMGRASLQDSAGNLWFGTRNGGLLRHTPATGEWRVFSSADGLSHHNVHAIAEDSAGKLWVGTNAGGVNHFGPDGEDWRVFGVQDGLVSEQVLAILEDSSGDLWFGTTAGVSRFRPATGAWTTFTVADGLAHDIVWSIIEDRTGILWFATRAGVSRYDGAGWTTFTTADGLVADEVWSMVQDSRGHLWFGTSSGVSRLNPAAGTWRTFTQSDGLAGSGALVIARDAPGNIWFAQSGLSRYDGAAWRTFRQGDGLAWNETFEALVDRSGDLWFGTGGGVSRFDGTAWTTFTVADGLAADSVFAVLQDSSDDYWFGTWGGGVSRFDGTLWTTFSRADGLADDTVLAAFEDASGDLWFGTLYGGVSRYDGQGWTTFTAADGLGSRSVYAIDQDPTGNIWFALPDRPAVSRFDPSSGTWTTVGLPDSLPENGVTDVHVDAQGNVWCATFDRGVARFDGTSWTVYSEADGLADYKVYSIGEDLHGRFWFGTRRGVSSFDPSSGTWRTFATGDGLAHPLVRAVQVDLDGAVWFATSYGVSAHDPDLVPPVSVLLIKPDPLVASPQLDFGVAATFGEAHIEFQYKLDGEPWSAWSSFNAYRRSDVAEGLHTFQVRSRDRDGNVELAPVSWTFEIDSAAPIPVIASPAFGEAVRGVATVSGRAADDRFREYRVEVRPSGTTSWVEPGVDLLAVGTAPVASGPLSEWDTTVLPDGRYDLRLTVSDTLGLVGTAITEVLVDNEEPWAEVTSPVLLLRAEGGEVYGPGGDLRVYFPPRAFDVDVTVQIEAVLDPARRNALPPSATVRRAYDVSWGDGVLEKTGTIEFSLAGLDPSGSTPPAVWVDSGEGWGRVGGTHDGTARVTAPLLVGGVYALLEGGGGSGSAGLFVSLSMTPRVFSPHGSFASRDVAISFSLERDAAVSVKVYNRAGRLVRRVEQGRVMRSGLNVARWNGRDDDGTIVPDGLYVVTLEALGDIRKETLAVVR